MPKAIDFHQLTIPHHPTRRITEELPRTPPFVSPAGIPIVQQLMDALIQGFHAWPSTKTGFKPADLLRMGADLGIGLGELNHVAMRVTKLEGAVSHALENFSTYVQNALSLDPAKWLQTYFGSGGGTLGTQQGFAVFQTAADTVNKIAAAINKVPGVSDLQQVAVTISKPLTDLAASANTILARVDPTKPAGDHVFAKLTDSTAAIGFVKNEVTTILGEISNPLKNGSTYSLEAGVKDASGAAMPGVFRLLENSREILKVTDAAIGTAKGSSVGAAFRHAGFGTLAPNPKARPGIVAAFSAFTH